MSMKHWPQELARKLGKRLGIKHELQTLKDSQISAYLENKLSTIPVQDFLMGVSPEDLDQDEELPKIEEEIASFEDED